MATLKNSLRVNCTTFETRGVKRSRPLGPFNAVDFGTGQVARLYQPQRAATATNRLFSTGQLRNGTSSADVKGWHARCSLISFDCLNAFLETKKCTRLLDFLRCCVS